MATWVIRQAASAPLPAGFFTMKGEWSFFTAFRLYLAFRPQDTR